MLYTKSLSGSVPLDLSDATGAVNLTSFLGTPGEGAIGNMNVGPQALKIHAQSDTAGTTAQWTILWVRNTAGTRYVERTLTGGTAAATARRTSADGASGSYVCDVAVGGVTNGLIDLCPYAEGKVDASFLEVWFLQTAVTSGTTTYNFYFTRYVS